MDQVKARENARNGISKYRTGHVYIEGRQKTRICIRLWQDAAPEGVRKAHRFCHGPCYGICYFFFLLIYLILFFFLLIK